MLYTIILVLKIAEEAAQNNSQVICFVTEQSISVNYFLLDLFSVFQNTVKNNERTLTWSSSKSPELIIIKVGITLHTLARWVSMRQKTIFPIKWIGISMI